VAVVPFLKMRGDVPLGQGCLFHCRQRGGGVEFRGWGGRGNLGLPGGGGGGVVSLGKGWKGISVGGNGEGFDATGSCNCA